ncbi:MAG: DUF2007 domain-containing protein [Archangiaceae bacterium]|nr:DUF2007 domain-containing protein [Archangiaceae bacterium]
MSDDGEQMVMLAECEDGLEAESLRGLLEAHGIAHVVHGDTRTSLGAYVVDLAGARPVIFVPKSELETATALLQAKPQLDSTETDSSAVLDGNVCPVHERPAVAICSRCGTFLCAGCGSLGSPPLCEDCLKIDEPRTPRGALVKAGAAVGLIAYALPLLIAAALILALIFLR